MKRPGVVLIIALLLCVVIGAIGYFMLVGPKKATIDKKQKEIEATESKIQTEKSTFTQLSNIKAHVAEYEAKLASLHSKIPGQPELPSLIRSIQAAADPGTGAGIPWLSFKPGDVSGSEGAAGFSNYTFSMSVAGFYDEVVDLIYRMERMQRAVAIDSVSMAPTSTILEQEFMPNLGLVTVQISAKTFTFYQAPTAGGPQPTTGPQPQGSTPSSTPSK